MKKTLIIASVLVLVLTFGSLVMAEELVFSDSFEDGVVDGHPAGWIVNHDFGGVISDNRSSDGRLSVQLNNTPDLFGEISKEIPEVAVGKLIVDFYQVNAFRENLNVEVHNESGRIVGVFITASGKVRPRDGGEQTGDLAVLANDTWHSLVLTWDETSFSVYHLDAFGNMIAILEDAALDPAHIDGGPANKILINMSPRADAKEAYIDNVRVYDLSK